MKSSYIPFQSMDSNSHLKKWRRVGIVAVILVLGFYILVPKMNQEEPKYPPHFSRKFLARKTSVSGVRFLSANQATQVRLGNHLFELAAVYGISQTLARTPVFWIRDERYVENLERTRQIMPGLVEQFVVNSGEPPVNKTAFHSKVCSFDDPKRLADRRDEYLHLSGHYYQSWKYFADRKEELLSYLIPPKRFEGLPESNDSTLVNCIHVRRGDFKEVGYHASEELFIRKAKEFIENRQHHKKHLSQKTVIFGDDPAFMSQLFPDTVHSNAWIASSTAKHFVSRNSPPEDLLYSSQHCDSVLISAPVSTFGWWIGYLSKGNDVFYLDVRTVNDGLYKAGQIILEDLYPPRWTSLKMNADNSTVIESEI